MPAIVAFDQALSGVEAQGPDVELGQQVLGSPISLLEHRDPDIPLACDIGGGLLLTHPNGVVIHPGASIGPNCLIFQLVTIGSGGPVPSAPTLGGHVDVGVGAKILGGVMIGNHARIGANAVVLQEVPAGATAVGIPARIIPAAHNSA